MPVPLESSSDSTLAIDYSNFNRFFAFVFTGSYMPSCDDEGYYTPTQCHSATGMCWCVDKHGVEAPNSRIRGKPECGELFVFFCILSHF